MGDTIKLKKGLKVNRPDLQLSELTCDNDPGNERLVYGGVNGPVEFPNKNDIDSINLNLSQKVELIIGENIPPVSSRKRHALYFKITDKQEVEGNLNTSEIKVSPTLGIKLE